MTPKRAVIRKPNTPDPSLPEVLIPPSEARDDQRSAYWLELIQNPEQFKDAIQTEEFFPMLKDFPEALWGDRLTLYLYRLPDDEGVMVKNAEGERKHIMVARFPVDEEWVSRKFGGGKYQGWLKLDSKETLRKHTFRIDGPPKVQPGQTIEIDGKPVSIASNPAPAPAGDSRSDVAAVISASADANRQNMEILAEGSKAAIQLVRDQAVNSAKPDASNSLLEKLLPALLERVLAPPPPQPNPLETLRAAKELFAETAAPAEKETPLDETLGVIQRLTGKDSIADLIRPHAKAESDYGWVTPVVGAVQQFIGQLPSIMHEARISREMEFRRQVWLRTAKAGEPPPAELLANNPAPPAPRPIQTATAQSVPAQPTQPAAVPKLDIGTLANLIVQTICHGFDSNPRLGYQTAGTIDVLYGRQIEDFGLDKFIADEHALTEYIRGVPPLAERSQMASWRMFQEEFLEYTLERWGADEDGGEDEESLAVMPVGPKKPNSGEPAPPPAA